MMDEIRKGGGLDELNPDLELPPPEGALIMGGLDEVMLLLVVVRRPTIASFSLSLCLIPEKNKQNHIVFKFLTFL